MRDRFDGHEATSASNGLAGSALRASGWAVALRIVDRALTFVVVLVLARLLDSEAFGLFGIVLLSTSALDVFTKTGLEPFLIYDRRGDLLDFDSAWVIQVGRGVAQASILYLVAPLISLAFSAPAATSLVRASCLALLLSSLKNPAVVDFQKRLNFRMQFLHVSAGSLLYFATAIPLGFILGNAWALVIAMVGKEAGVLVSSYVLHPFRPSFRLDARRLRGLIGFGGWITATQIVVFLATQGDDALVGSMLGVSALGSYQVAYRISNLVTTELTLVVSQVAYPVYVNIVGSPKRLASAYLSSVGGILTVAAPFTLFLVVETRSLVVVALGPAWSNVVAVVRVLAISGLLRSIIVSGAPAYRARGRPDADFRMNVARLLVLAALIVPLTLRAGLTGTGIAVCFGLSAAIVIWWVQIRSLLAIDSRDLLRELSAPLIASGIAALFLSVLPISVGSQVLELILHGLAYATLYLLVIAGIGKLLPKWSVPPSVLMLLRSYIGSGDGESQFMPPGSNVGGGGTNSAED